MQSNSTGYLHEVYNMQLSRNMPLCTMILDND